MKKLTSFIKLNLGEKLITEPAINFLRTNGIDRMSISFDFHPDDIEFVDNLEPSESFCTSIVGENLHNVTSAPTVEFGLNNQNGFVEIFLKFQLDPNKVKGRHGAG